MSEFPRADLLFLDENPYQAAQDPRPVFGTERIVSRLLTNQSQLNLRFIYGVDASVDRHALVEQIGGSEIVVYCSDWGSGEPDVPGLAEAVEADVRHFQDPDSDIEGIELPDAMHPVIKTLLVELQGANKDFYCGGSFQPDEEVNALDIARGEAHEIMGVAILGFKPITEIIASMDVYTSRAAQYNCAVERRAYEQIHDILQEHEGVQVAIVTESSYPLLPRYFAGDEGQSALTMSRYHMPLARLISGMVKAETIGREIAEEKGERFEENEFLYDPVSLEPAHRPFIEQIIFLKQVGASVPTNLYYNALYGLIANYIVSRDDMYGPDVEYRMIDNPYAAREQLEFFEARYWTDLSADNDVSEEVRNATMNDFMRTWLRISL